jgi:hypothetical protein
LMMLAVHAVETTNGVAGFNRFGERAILSAQ